MPGWAPFAGARILQRLPLQAFLGEAQAATIGNEPVAIRGHDVGHWSAKPDMTMEPEAAVHRVHHAVAPAGEFAGKFVRCPVGHASR